MAEYFSFISLLSALFVVSGGILIKVNRQGTPLVNTLLLAFGAVIANLIGTTGASMLLIRPFIRINKERIKPYHIVFFIFIVSNVGGSLTPIGDPPLFLGFIKGVPFFLTLLHNWPIWLTACGILLLTFYILDRKNQTETEVSDSKTHSIEIKGKVSFVWLSIIIAAVFLDPNLVEWVPFIPYHEAKISFLRELIMITAAWCAYRFADKECLRENEFNFVPIKEVAFLFIGIFATMIPALQLIGEFARSHQDQVTDNTLYWSAGILSSILDNAPTYVNFLSAGMGDAGLDIMSKADVLKYASSPETISGLVAVSIASVFFGACTYIGNAPNFMVKSIAEQAGIQMPSFFGYVVRFTMIYLVPELVLIWILFIH